MKYTLAVLCTLVVTANAFGVAPTGSCSNTALYLLPTQGNQLVAASSSAYEEHDGQYVKTEDSSAALHPRYPSISAARSFASKVFSLPASLLHPHPKEIPDEVIFPVTGFQYVRDKADHCRVLPTVSNPSCRLPADEKPVFGWYSPVCRLDYFSDDLYSKKP